MIIKAVLLNQYFLKSTQYKMLAPNVLQVILKFKILQTTWKYKTKNIKKLDLSIKNWKLRVWCSLFNFFMWIWVRDIRLKGTEDGRSNTDFMYWPINLQCFSVVNLRFFGNVYLLTLTKYFFALIRGKKFSEKLRGKHCWSKDLLD